MTEQLAAALRPVRGRHGHAAHAELDRYFDPSGADDAACAVIGLNRGARGHAAGFRTTILVGLAASVAMIQANILLPLSGKTPESFSVMDLMRLPLGILTGVGFIGGGTIVKKGDLVVGVTTAATLWLVTVIGLCLGGGQLILGMVATGLAVVTLWVLKWIDVMIPREHRARLNRNVRPFLGHAGRGVPDTEPDALSRSLLGTNTRSGGGKGGLYV